MHITPGCTISLKSSLSVLRQRTHKIPIKAIKPEIKSYMVASLMESLPMEYVNSMMVRQCLQDAARINNVILLPGNYKL